MLGYQYIFNNRLYVHDDAIESANVVTYVAIYENNDFLKVTSASMLTLCTT